MIRRLWPLTLCAFALGLDADVLAGVLPGMARDLAPARAPLGGRWTIGLVVAISLAAAAGVAVHGSFPTAPVIPRQDRLAALRTPLTWSRRG